MLIIDGSQGEGGGQILRTALALSLCLNTPFKIINIRRHRERPGLQPQHLAAVQAAARIADARLEGDSLHSQQLLFQPDRIRPGEYQFDIGTAGSTSLVLQTVLPALMRGSRHSKLTVSGGTHNPLAPTYEFLEYVFFPLLHRMGPVLQSKLVRPGFYPKGGGEVIVTIQPVTKLQPIYLVQRGELVNQHARILLAHLPRHVAQRERHVIQQQLGYTDEQLQVIYDDSAFGPGNVVSLIAQFQQLTEVFTALGKPGLPAEQVAQSAIDKLQAYISSQAPVDSHLADQLLLPVALAGEGIFHTRLPSNHTRTNMEIIHLFTGKPFACRELTPDRWEISLT